MHGVIAVPCFKDNISHVSTEKRAGTSKKKVAHIRREAGWELMMGITNLNIITLEQSLQALKPCAITS